MALVGASAFVAAADARGAARLLRSRAAMCAVRSGFPARTKRHRSRPSVIVAQTSGVGAASPGEALPEENLPRRLLVAFLSGVTASLVGSLVGVGGGVVLTPLLTSVLAVPQHAAHGTSLVSISITSAVGAWKYLRSGALSINAALALCVIAVVTARLGSVVAQSLPANRLKRYFGWYLVVVAFLLQLKHITKAPPPSSAVDELASGLNFTSFSRTATLLGILGSMAGFLGGLLGVGGGTVLVPGLTLLAGFPQRLAQGTALAAMVFPSLSAMSSYLSRGNVRVALVLPILPGSILGATIGASLAVKLSNRVLSIFAGIVFLYSGVSMLRKTRIFAPQDGMKRSLSDRRGDPPRPLP